MILYLIRHGHAEERDTFKGKDIDRPLTAEGQKRAKEAFSNFLKKYKQPKAILASQAVRSVETASILGELCGVKYDICPSINPGAEIKDYINLIGDWRHADVLAVVGHEPDLSETASFIVSGGALRMELKKGSIIHIEDSVLINLIQQKALL